MSGDAAYVVAGYLLTAGALAGYTWHLVRRIRASSIRRADRGGVPR